MSWTLTDMRGGAVAGPFDSAHEAIDTRRSYPYLRIDRHADGHYDPVQLSQDLRRWFSEHFRTHDARLHSMLPHH